MNKYLREKAPVNCPENVEFFSNGISGGNVSGLIFGGNADADAYNKAALKDAALLSELRIPQDCYTISAVTYAARDFAKKHLLYLIGQGFLGKEDYPYISEEGARIYKDRLYLPAGIMHYTSVSSDYSLLKVPEITKEIRKSLAATPVSDRQALMQYELCLLGHEILCDRLYTVSCSHRLTERYGFLKKWESVTHENDLKPLCSELALPESYKYLSILKKIYGISLYNGNISVNPSRAGLPSISVNAYGKQILITYTQGYPKKTYCGDKCFWGGISLDCDAHKLMLTVTC